ncbi:MULTISPECIES: TonB-dependent receptor [unclassified Sphingobacterium]|uniref:SusC/RagA family TonB-linked outer membrane protein n=1 Tax=unclassified Sphingobacterium TaxID=2609468 RepID=UPI0010F17AAC|nr:MULTISPECIES: TonB-dependent receptor [unclassified Sphingobacterium]MCS3553241.1 TonB-linked SusC/RagA family outer membrane protein [Sphingobacterium sp. JUb21]TCR09549.1 TonB-linked SusC/RagA family outer membrane protein [Sphingobacterium sp. JUb20]
MNKFDARTFLQLKKNSKLFFSLAVIAGSMQQVNASSATLSGYAHVSKAKELVTKQGQVSGKIVDSSGNPVSGVTVSVKGTSVGTQTSETGSFSINAKVGDMLVISSVGFKTAETRVSSTSGLTIRLESAADVLDEVVVVGYGTMRKSDVTGSIAMVKGADMIKDQNFSPLDNLRGKASGVNIFSNSSQPGAYGNKVIIRGMGTINSSSNPLYVVDGVVMEDFQLLNPNDIESIEVLKDASSAAIYGARGANGVILVTTKRGNKDGRRTISYQGSTSVSSPQRYMDLLNAQEWTDAFMIGLENENKYQAKFLTEKNPNWKPWSLDRKDWFNDPDYFDANGNPLYDTDWQREATRTAISQNHQLSMQQGDEKSSVGAFLNYTDQQGIVNNTFSKRLNGKMAYDSKPTSWLSTAVNLSVNHTWGRYTPEDGGGQDARRTMIEMLPWLPVRDKLGVYTNSASSKIADVLGFEGMANPVSILELQKRTRYNTQIFGNAALTFHLAEGLDLKTQFGVDSHQKRYQGYSSITLNNISRPNGWAEREHTNTFYWQEETYLTYNKQFDKHRINAMAGLSWQARTYDFDNSRTEGFFDDFYETNNMGIGILPAPPGSNWNKWAMNSYFLRASYSYDNRYSATVTSRYDGSSKFGKNNKYAFFPSAGLAWNVSNEDFLKGNESISNLKLHTSYGLTGNSEIDPYKSLAIVEAGTILLNNNRAPYSFVSTIANPDLKWEKTAQYDIGVELGLFQNRLNFDVSYYHKKTTDLLLDAPVPTASGFSTVMKNIGSVQNQGLDIMISGTVVSNENFSWKSSLNMNYNKNKVLKLGENNADILMNSWVGGPNSVIRVGENLNSFYGYRRLGVYTQEDINNGTATLGQFGRPKRTTEKEIIGKGLPDWTGSFINNLKYKNFDFTLDLQFVKGVEVMQQFYHSTYDRFGITNGLKEILTDAYNGTNPNTMEQAIYLSNGGHADQDTNVDDSWVADGSYIRVNLIQLGYTFNPDVLKRVGMSNLRIYANANNPFLFTSSDFKGYDPESTSQGTGNFGQNMTFFAYPRAKTFSLGVNVTF